MTLRLAAIIALAGCSSGTKTPPVEDARRPRDDTRAAVAPDASPPPDAADVAPTPTTPTTGDVSVRVEWTNMPRALRVSAGESACGTPLAPQATPTTTWGVPDVIVFVEGAPAAIAETRVVAGRCTVDPRIAIGTTVAIASSADRPQRLSLQRVFGTADLKAVAEPARSIALPIAGHEATATLVPDGIYRLADAGGAADEAWVVSANAVITDASGAALIKDLAPGSHRVQVWLPPRGTQPARAKSGVVEVAVGELAELTLSLP